MVDASNGNLTFSHIAELSASPLVWFDEEESPFMSWFAECRIPVQKALTGPTAGDMVAGLHSLLRLKRSVTCIHTGPGVHAVLLSMGRGCVYSRLGDKWLLVVAEVRGREITPDPSWRVLRITYTGAVSYGKLTERHRFPTADAKVTGHFTHFIVPLETSSGWNSAHDGRAHRGYFLDASIEFGKSVPDITLAWMAQASSILANSNNRLHGGKPLGLRIPTRTRLYLSWEMILTVKDLATSPNPSVAMSGLPDSIHVFVQIPKTNGHRVEEPKIYWSTDADVIETAGVPSSAFVIRMGWHVQEEVARWESHHYEIAKSLQERHGFDPGTHNAAKYHQLPLLEVTATTFEQDARVPDSDWRRCCSRDPHTLEILEDSHEAKCVSYS
ncbi:hypothetical protein C8R47DRAFT_616860 [Mycena vitilis]|nr:hypothetical protein C8R47DRAFT_616860 [Mycena vitilis]